MSNCVSQIEERPFRSRADLARDFAIRRHYHSLAIPAVVAALQIKGRSEDAASRRMQRSPISQPAKAFLH